MTDHVARLGRIVAMLEASDYPTRQHLARYRERLSKLNRQMETITMTDNTHDTDAQLIETLRGLTPTEGEWEVDRRPHSPANIIMGIVAEKGNDDGDWVVSVVSHGIRVEADTLTLILAAPAMRALILRQADELAAFRRKRDHAETTSPTEPTYALTGEPVALEHINAYKEGWYDGQAAAQQQIEALKAQLAAVTTERDGLRVTIQNGGGVQYVVSPRLWEDDEE